MYGTQLNNDSHSLSKKTVIAEIKVYGYATDTITDLT